MDVGVWFTFFVSSGSMATSFAVGRGEKMDMAGSYQRDVVGNMTYCDY